MTGPNYHVDNDSIDDTLDWDVLTPDPDPTDAPRGAFLGAETQVDPNTVEIIEDWRP